MVNNYIKFTDDLEPRVCTLELYLNGYKLGGLQHTSYLSPIDVQYLFEIFKKDIDNLLENGLIGNERVKDVINQGRFKGFNYYELSYPIV